MSNTARAILRITGLVLLLCYLVFALSLPDHKQQLVCQQVTITIKDSLNHQFLTGRDVNQQLRQNNLPIVGNQQINIPLAQVEHTIEQLEVVRSAECYFLNDGSMNIIIEQREPKLRIITAGGNYYVDTERKIMKATSHTAAFVPIITGSVTEQLALNELYNFVDWLEDQPFWYAQIEQINLTPRREVELVPRVGGHIILLGSLNDYEAKLHKLQTFYTEGLAKIGWQPYREIDLRFQNQIVCRK